MFQLPTFLIGIVCGIHVNVRETNKQGSSNALLARRSGLALFGFVSVYTVVKYFHCTKVLQLSQNDFLQCAHAIPLVDTATNKCVIIGLPLFLHIAGRDHVTLRSFLPKWTLFGQRYGLQSFLWAWPATDLVVAIARPVLPRTEWVVVAQAALAAPFLAGNLVASVRDACEGKVKKRVTLRLDSDSDSDTDLSSDALVPYPTEEIEFGPI